MMLLLPALAFFLFFQIFRSLQFEWRKAVLAAAVFWGTALTLIVELLSLPELLTPWTVTGSWIAICAGAALYLLACRRPARLAGTALPAGGPLPARLDPASKIMLALATVLFALVAIVAVVAPPSSWDAMQTYLPRVSLWISNRSVQFYPTPDYLQLIFAPWPSYAMLHSILLSGTDRFVNLIQVLSLLGCAIAVSLIAGKLGAGTFGQTLAAVVSLTIPQGILEASGALNSYVVSFWIATTVAFLLLWKDETSWLNTISVGLAAGLALLSKGHAYIFLPFIVLACWWMGSWPTRIMFLKRSLVFVLAILVINAPTFIRNYDLTASPLGLPLPEPFRQSMIMDDFRASAIVANTIRHLSAHVGTPVQAINTATDSALRRAIGALGIDPDQSIYAGDTFHVNRFSRHELLAGNPLHLVLLAGSFALVFVNCRRRTSRDAFLYSAGICLSFVFMSATLIWQTTTSRYHLPLFVLGSAVCGLIIERYLSRTYGTVAGVALVAIAAIGATANQTRSLLPSSREPNVYQERPYLYFADFHETDFPAHSAAAAAVNKLACRDVAIDSVLPKGLFRDSKGSLFVYPILALINPSGLSRSISYAGVHNLTIRYEKPHPTPCAVVCFNCANLPEKWLEYRKIGGRASIFDNIVLFSAQGDRPNSP
jgi:hypothetical protein